MGWCTTDVQPGKPKKKKHRQSKLLRKTDSVREHKRKHAGDKPLVKDGEGLLSHCSGVKQRRRQAFRPQKMHVNKGIQGRAGSRPRPGRCGAGRRSVQQPTSRDKREENVCVMLGNIMQRDSQKNLPLYRKVRWASHTFAAKANKGTRRMPWRQVPMKDAVHCEKLG